MPRKTIDVTPTWESTARMLLTIIKHGRDPKNIAEAEREIVRMGKIIDQQQEQTK